MCNCTACSSADVSGQFICIACHTNRMQEALNVIERLQRELLTVNTSYSFCKLALKQRTK